jgi:O-acetyl-ADP-ribose deacetylase (regulator of RNase III)
MPIIKTIYGDLLDFPVIAHCISADAAMGAGLAAQITKKYPFLQEAIRAKKLVPGEVFIFKNEEQLIFNICTKKLYWQHIGSGITNTDYVKNLKTGLTIVFEALGNFAKMTGAQEETLWIPRLGCGLDRGYWPEVASLFTAVEQNIILVEKKDGKEL